MDKLVRGSLLVSQPGLADPNFRSTVVLVTEHNSEGAFGLVLNRRGQHRVADLWESLTDQRSEVESQAFVGGPVQPAAVFLLHRREDLAPGEKPVIPGLFLGSSIDLLRGLLESSAERSAREPDDFRVYCGYSGWGPGQLDGELRAGGWLIQSATAEFIFETKPDLLWQRTMDREGGLYRFFSFMPPSPEMN